jgi:hypothetical protein
MQHGTLSEVEGGRPTGRPRVDKGPGGGPLPTLTLATCAGEQLELHRPENQGDPLLAQGPDPGSAPHGHAGGTVGIDWSFEG